MKQMSRICLESESCERCCYQCEGIMTGGDFFLTFLRRTKEDNVVKEVILNKGLFLWNPRAGMMARNVDY